MSKVRKEKVHPIGRIKGPTNLIKEEEDSSQTRVLEVRPRTSPKTTTRKLIIRTRYPRILHHQKGEIYLTILLQVLNNENLSNYRNAKDHTTLSIVQTGREIPTTYTLYKKKKQLWMWPTRCTGSMQH